MTLKEIIEDRNNLFIEIYKDFIVEDEIFDSFCGIAYYKDGELIFLDGEIISLDTKCTEAEFDIIPESLTIEDIVVPQGSEFLKIWKEGLIYVK